MDFVRSAALVFFCLISSWAGAYEVGEEQGACFWNGSSWRYYQVRQGTGGSYYPNTQDSTRDGACAKFGVTPARQQVGGSNDGLWFCGSTQQYSVASPGSATLTQCLQWEPPPPPPPECDFENAFPYNEVFVTQDIAEIPALVCATGKAFDSGCIYQVRAGSKTCMDYCGATYDPIDAVCDQEQGIVPDGSEGTSPPPAEVCQTSPGMEYCISPESSQGAQCGFLNDSYVCLSNTPDGGCQSAAGGVICDADAGSPPAPDSGTRSDPASPDGQVTTETAGGNVNTYNFFNSTTVAGSSTTPTTGTTGAGSDTNGDGLLSECEITGECGTGSASGGGTCDAAPTCDGDPILCLTLRQQWETRCNLEGMEGSEIDAAVGRIGTEVQGSGLLAGDETGTTVEASEWGNAQGMIGSQSCPQGTTITVMGQTIEMDIWGPACTMATLFAPLSYAIGLLLGALAFARIVGTA